MKMAEVILSQRGSGARCREPGQEKKKIETWAVSSRPPSIAHFARREQRFYYFRRGCA
jgi:hypothetical protein